MAWWRFSRAPDFVIGTGASPKGNAEADRPYLRRWWLLPRNRLFNIYLHHFLRSDDDRALHDHPWPNVSILLTGSYVEVLPATPARPNGALLTTRLRQRFAVVARGPRAAHRVSLLRDEMGRERPVWTLFITGPKVRDWGFWCPRGWVPWQRFTDPANYGEVGPGCDAEPVDGGRAP